MPHNGFLYEARIDMKENSGHCVKSDSVSGEECKEDNLFYLKVNPQKEKNCKL